MTGLLFRLFFVLMLLGVLAGPDAQAEEEGRVFTLWPLLDYRRSETADYTSVNALGPFITYERKGPEREFGVRPLFFRASDQQGNSYGEYLYPVASGKSQPDRSYLQVFQLYRHDFGSQAPRGDNEFTLFPIVFYGESPEQGEYFAFFPFGGTIYDRLWRDEIHFALFPLYGRTRKKETTVTNVLWPFFARVQGEKESGIKIWPLWGQSDKEGVYRKRFLLWPVFSSYDLRLDTDNPVHRRTVFPLYVGADSPEESSRTWLWPFFNHIENRRLNYEEWTFPWPLFRVARGETRQWDTYLPFYADERVGARRKRWFLWPIYKIEEIHSELIDRRRDRVLFFLFSNLEEKRVDEEFVRKKRVALWPLFTYQRERAVSHFYTLSLLEPFFPDNEGFARNWSPLWRLYQRKWDTSGNEISSLLWNLYWKEKRGEDLAWELFPLVRYRSHEKHGLDVRVLKGLFRYREQGDQRDIGLFFFPSVFHWGKDP